jgi:hypothetical protein
VMMSVSAFAVQEQNYIVNPQSLQYKKESLLPSTLPPGAQDYCP